MGYKHRLFLSLGHRGFFNWMDDATYLKIAYRLTMGKKLDLEHPTTYNEKLQWLKLYNRRREYTDMADKYKVYDFVKKTIGEEYLIPLLGVWNTPEEIPWEELPRQFVLKCTHDSGGVVIVKDKDAADREKIAAKLRKILKINYFYGDREWPYKDIEPRIIAQAYMTDESCVELKDYKFFCFDGEPAYMFVAKGRQAGSEAVKFNFYDMDFRLLPFKNGHENFTEPMEKPLAWEEMKRVAARLSAGIPHVRVDLYDINGKVYFGEMTFFHWSGMVPFEPEEWDRIFGERIRLPEKTAK
ncbi:MAG: glycosyl transferase [Oscillibacter sp.]|nr:glycosyl transferase [Oscillibacter sp.]